MLTGVSWRDLGLIPRRGADLPRSWTRFANRNKGAEFLGNKHASHPINAMLNYCTVVEAGRLARALTAKGMALQVGFFMRTSMGEIRLFGIASNRCARGSTPTYSPSSADVSLAGRTFRRAALRFIASPGRSSPNYCAIVFCPIATFWTRRSG